MSLTLTETPKTGFVATRPIFRHFPIVAGLKIFQAFVDGLFHLPTKAGCDLTKREQLTTPLMAGEQQRAPQVVSD